MIHFLFNFILILIFNFLFLNNIFYNKKKLKKNVILKRNDKTEK